MRNDLSQEDSEFLENLRTHLNWDEYWSGEWEVLAPVSNAYLPVDNASKEEIKTGISILPNGVMRLTPTTCEPITSLSRSMTMKTVLSILSQSQ